MKRQMRCRVGLGLFGGLMVAATLSACGMATPLRAEMRPLDLAQAAPSAPALLTQNHFRRDAAGSISEDDLRRVLDAPVFLEAQTRIGVVPVTTGYEPDPDLPLAAVPAAISTSLEGAGLFEATSEVSTDWPADRGISGLRELAARYRTEYLLLYRQRFVDRAFTNAWAWLYPTVIPAFFVPAHTLEVAGILEATLFDVRTGTLLFTVYERIGATANENVWHNDRKRRLLKEKLLAKAADALATSVVAKCRRLAAARPGGAAESLAAAGRAATEQAGAPAVQRPAEPSATAASAPASADAAL